MRINVRARIIDTIECCRVSVDHLLWRGVGRESGSEVVVIPISNFSWKLAAEPVSVSGRSVDIVP